LYCLSFFLGHLWERFGDTKGVMQSLKSKDKQYNYPTKKDKLCNDQTKKDNRTNNTICIVCPFSFRYCIVCPVVLFRLVIA
jgi:hypothetical protein